MRFILALMLTSTPVFAGPCADHGQLTAALKDQYGETTQVQAMSGDGRMMQLLANPDTGSWSAIMIDATGNACLVASGDRFTPTKQGDPA